MFTIIIIMYSLVQPTSQSVSNAAVEIQKSFKCTRHKVDVNLYVVLPKEDWSKLLDNNFLQPLIPKNK